MTAVPEAPVLITGGAGFIGSNLADRLAREGHDVIVLDSLARAGVADNLAWLQRRHPDRITAVRADVHDTEAVKATVGLAGAVFHLAAQVAVTTSLTDPRLDFETNVAGTLNLLEALRHRGGAVPLVFASTNKVYGDLSDIPLEVAGDAYRPCDPILRATGVAEDRPLDFHTPYGCSKGAADQYVLDYARSFGLSACVLRMSCIYGPRQMGTEDQGWVAHFLIRALQGQPISIYGDGRQVRDILHVADAVDTYIAAWRDIDTVRGKAFNLGGGPANAVSLRQLIAHIEELLGRQVATAYGDWRAGDQRYYVSDSSAVRAALNLPAPRDWRTGVADLADWLRTASPRRRPKRQAEGSRPLRLLMTTDAVGGVWTYALDLAGALASSGVRTTLAVLGPAPDDAARSDACAVPGLELVETGLTLDWMAETTDEMRDAARAVDALAARCHADLVHLNGPALAAGAAFPVPVVGACHSCLATWWAAVRGGDMPETFRWRAGANRDGAPRLPGARRPDGRVRRRDRPRLRPAPRAQRGPQRPPHRSKHRRPPRAPGLHRRPPLGRRQERRHPRTPPQAWSTPRFRRRRARRPQRHRDLPLPRPWPPGTSAGRGARLARPLGGLCLCRPLRAVRPCRARGRAGRLRPRAFRHPVVPRALGRRRGLRPTGRPACVRRRAAGPPRHPRPDRRTRSGGACPLPPLYATGDGGSHAPPLRLAPRHPSGRLRGRGVKVVYFTHSLASCWNRGNAHFLRGILRELVARGHEVTTWEPADGWSLANLLADHGEAALAPFRAAYPQLRSEQFGLEFDPAEACEGADLVIVHEWNEPALVAAVGRARRRGGRFLVLFHDTHHRAVSDPAAIDAFDLSAYDGVLAFGEALATVYRRWGWAIASSSGTRLPIRRSSVRPAPRDRARAWSGSATGATASAPPNSSSS
ncbi:MAG: SDR family NAD(P)-dependent oxidoreductase [Amaricoccus sp.]